MLYASLVVYLAVRDLGATAFDDSYFFKRFALNALEHGVFAWNVEDGPVHGSTSQLFQLVTTAVAAMTHTHFVAAVRLLNAVFLAVAGGMVMAWCARLERPRAGFGVAAVGLGGPLVLTTVLTGMETALALGVLTAVLVWWFAPRDTEHRPSAELAAALTVLVYLCRPDAAAIPAVAIGLDHLFRRKLPVRYFAVLAGLMGLTWVVLGAYYGTPLPLSFYMKTMALHVYDPQTAAADLVQKREHFGATTAFAAPLLWIVVRSGALRVRGPTMALLGAALAFWAYHLFSTTEIMGYRGRFYVPAFVPLVLAATRAWAGFEARPRLPSLIAALVWVVAIAAAYAEKLIPTGEGFFIHQVPWPAYAGVAGATVALLGLRSPWRERVVYGALAAGLLGWKPPQRPSLRSDPQLMRRHANEVTTMRGVFDIARCLPADSTVYHSEMGVTGLVLLRMRVVDLVGIVSWASGVGGRSFQQQCEEDRPAAIFLPHRNYRDLNAEVRRSQCFAEYVPVVERSSSPLHLRRDLAAPFLSCARDVHRWR